jgi:putative ABC transport system permease protein
MGLAVGMTACFLLFLYVRFEQNYDSFLGEANRILVATGILATLIVLFTVSFWTIRAVISNHVKSLRN